MQMPGLSVGIIADDLTGACDTALQFYDTDSESYILLDLPANEQDLALPNLPGNESRIWSVNTASRHCNPHEAHARVRQAVALCRNRYGVENFFKKIDSTLRGNIAHECLAMLDELKAQCAVIVPAYPQEGRRTVGGYQLVRGVPVEKTALGRDPLSPVRSSHLPTILEAATRPEIVGHITLSDVLHGAGPILVKLKALIEDGRKLIVVDATTVEDLEQIALAIEKAQKYHKVLPCGAAGLGRAIAGLWAIDYRESPKHSSRSNALSAPPTPIFIVSGSTTDVTRQQIMKLSENYTYYGQGSQLILFELQPEQILNIHDLETLTAKIIEALDGRNTVVLSTSLKEDSYIRTIEMAEAIQLTPQQASKMAEEALGRITAAILRKKAIKLVLAGGETTRQVCQTIQSHALEIVAEADASIPLMIDRQGRWIVTKSGSFGSPLALANVVKFMKQKETLPINA